MATDSRSSSPEYVNRRSCPIDRNDRLRQRLRSPSPAGITDCSYSRLSALRENAIFKKYLGTDKTESDGKSTGNTNSRRQQRAPSPRCENKDESVATKAELLRSNTEPSLTSKLPRSTETSSARIRRTGTEPCLGQRVQLPNHRRPIAIRRSETERCRIPRADSLGKNQESSKFGASGSSRPNFDTSRKGESDVKSTQSTSKNISSSQAAVSRVPAGSVKHITGNSAQKDSRESSTSIADIPSDSGAVVLQSSERPSSRLSRAAQKDTCEDDSENSKEIRRSRSAQRAGSREDRRQRYRRSLEFFAETKGKHSSDAVTSESARAQSASRGHLNVKQNSSQGSSTERAKPVQIRIPVRYSSVENLTQKFQKDSGNVSPSNSRRQGTRTPTPSFEEFKKRVRIPSFGEFKRQREENRNGPDDGHSDEIPPLSVPSTLLTRSNSTPSVAVSVSRHAISRNKTVYRSSRTADENKSKENLGEDDSKSSEICLAKGIRIKPSYISQSGEESQNPDEPEPETDVSCVDLDNSLDDNVIIAETKEEKGDPQLENRRVKQMDNEGNFWIVVDKVETDNNTYHYRGSTTSLSQSGTLLTKPPLPSSDNVLYDDPGELQTSVLRSTSDVSDLAVSSGRKRKERKERQYKSDPFSGTENSDSRNRPEQGRLFSGSSCTSVGQASSCTSVFSLEELPEDEADSGVSKCNRRNRGSNVSASSNDSGVTGPDLSRGHLRVAATLKTEIKDLTSEGSHVEGMCRRNSAYDLKIPSAETLTTTSRCCDCGKEEELMSGLCKKCESRKTERKRTLLEIVDTEATYRRDLKILKEEFYLPIKSAGLLTTEQLQGVFLNVDELLQVNYDFLQQLRELLKISTCSDYSGEETTSKTGDLFINASSQFLPFETYCVNQSNAASLLESYERDNELLRVFLQVSQNENSTLRKMNLKSFLVIPIQRITKYPLLLNRLYKSTPIHHKGRECIKEARERIEDILEHINGKTLQSGMGSVKIKRKRPESKSCSMLERFELIKVSQESLGWNRMEVSDTFVGKLQMAQPTDHTWAVKKGRTLKFSPVFVVVLTQGKSTRKISTTDKRMYPKPTAVKQAAMVLIREKNDRYLPVREPLFLHQCVLAVDDDYRDVFEIQEWNKECYILKAEQPEETMRWVQYLKQYWIDLSVWRRRRNALANIMIKQSS